MEMLTVVFLQIAYAIEIAAGNNPTIIVYDESEMRQHLLVFTKTNGGYTQYM